MELAKLTCVRAIILAGRLGQRLLEIDGEAILTRTVRLVLRAGVTEVTVVTGHCAPLVCAELERSFIVHRERIAIVHNPRYASTHTAYPLWLARFGLDEPLLLVDGDVVFDESALGALMAASAIGDVIAVGKVVRGNRSIVTVDALGHVSRVGRDLAASERLRQAAGLAVLSRATLTGLFPALERRVITLDRASDPYEAAFEDLLVERRLYMRALDVDGLRCVAIDGPEDVQRAATALRAGANA
jgi:choline kinase